jgi:hypothetical protein
MDKISRKWEKPSRKALLEFGKSLNQGCPVCQADEMSIDCDRPENQDGVVNQTCSCRNCGSSWCECFYRGDITEVNLNDD